jgi:SAM-dependent methyltransferase
MESKGHEIDPNDVHYLPPQSVALTSIDEGGWILDIGGGGEGIIGMMAGPRVVAIDLQRSELEETSNNALKIVMDARDLKFLDGTFGTVTAFFSFMFIPWVDLDQVFSEITRVLRPGGTLHIWDFTFMASSANGKRVVIFPITVALPDGHQVETGYGCKVRDQDMDDFIGLAERAGLHVESSERSAQIFRMVLRK